MPAYEIIVDQGEDSNSDEYDRSPIHILRSYCGEKRPKREEPDGDQKKERDHIDAEAEIS